MEIILEGGLEIQEQVDPVTPAAGFLRVYAKAKKLYQKDSDGVVTDLAQAGGGGGGGDSFAFFMS